MNIFYIKPDSVSRYPPGTRFPCQESFPMVLLHEETSMALIDCYKCGKQISDRASACPHCGAPVLKYIKLPDGSEFGFDENGNNTHKKYSDGTEIWYERDENGKVTHERKSDGSEIWYEYDENGK